MVFPFLAGMLMSRNLKWFIGRHFETVQPIFHCFAAFGFFFEYLISDPNCSAKFILKSMFLTTNGRTEDLDHLSVKDHAMHMS